MIHIISSGNDLTTDKVLEWLWSFDSEFQRIQDDHKVNISIEINNQIIKAQIENECIESMWMRRGGLPIAKYALEATSRENTKGALLKDEQIVQESIESIIPQRIGSYRQEKENNLLLDLQIAKKSGFRIPATLVTNSKNKALAFLNKYQCITKHLKYPPTVFINNTYNSNPGTQKVTTDQIKNLNDNFAPILLQEAITKKWELRVFVYHEKTYCLCSVNWAKATPVDQRYIPRSKLRFVPFQLNKEVKEYINQFMKLSGLSTTSIDILVNSQDEYYFLESNPMGQFDWVSQLGNFYIEKYIALCLDQSHSYQN